MIIEALKSHAGEQYCALCIRRQCMALFFDELRLNCSWITTIWHKYVTHTAYPTTPHAP